MTICFYKDTIKEFIEVTIKMLHIDNYHLNQALCLAQEATGMAFPSRCCRMQALTVPTASLAALHCTAIYQLYTG